MSISNPDTSFREGLVPKTHSDKFFIVGGLSEEACMGGGRIFCGKRACRVGLGLSSVTACLVFIDFIELICLTKNVFRFTFTWHAM